MTHEILCATWSESYFSFYLWFFYNLIDQTWNMPSVGMTQCRSLPFRRNLRLCCSCIRLTPPLIFFDVVFYGKKKKHFEINPPTLVWLLSKQTEAEGKLRTTFMRCVFPRSSVTASWQKNVTEVQWFACDNESYLGLIRCLIFFCEFMDLQLQCTNCAPCTARSTGAVRLTRIARGNALIHGTICSWWQ